MKRITSFLFFVSASLMMMAQSGPGGVGNSTNLILWLNADSISALNGTPISTWNDISSQNNDAVQSTTANQPILYVDSVNSHNVLHFDGVNDFMDLSNHITTNSVSMYVVFDNTVNVSLDAYLLSTFRHELLSKSQILQQNGRSALEYGSRRYIIRNRITNKLSTISGQVQQLTSIIRTSNRGNENVVTNAPTVFNNNSNSVIGAYHDGTNASGFHYGNIAEIVLYNDTLNPVQRRILMNSLTAKYGNDMFDAAIDHYLFQNNFSHQVVGIGQLNGFAQTEAKGHGVVRLLNPEHLANDEFLLIGHDNGILDTTSNNIPENFESRVTRIWRADKTGDVGLVDLEFYLDANSSSNLALTAILIDDDGDFSNGVIGIHDFGRTVFAQDGYVSFSDVSLPDSSYFTLATLDEDNIIHSVQNGAWNIPTTWDCSCIPDIEDMVFIVDSHVVSLNTEQSVGSLTILDSAILNLTPGSILHMFDTLNIYGSINNDSSLISVDGNRDVTFFNHRSDALSSPIAFHSVEINNPLGLTLNNSLWDLKSSIQINLGKLTNNGTFTFLSNQDNTAQILPSSVNSFVGSGSYIMERYISSRRAEYINIAAPTSTTVDDWDQEIYMSGVGGNDGNSQYSPTGPIYYSVFTFNTATATYDTVTSVSTAVVPGVGFELFLGDNLLTYTPTELGIINVHGVPYTGDLSINISPGFMLLGNPYQSFVDWGQVSKPGSVPNSYYAFEASSGNYALYTSATAIPPSQSFWIDVPSTGAGQVTFSENDKVYMSANSSTFLRNKYNSIDSIIVAISNSENPYHHQHIIELNPMSTRGFDNNDYRYLPSRLKGVPALYSTVTDEITETTKDVMINSIGTSMDEQSIPLHFTAGLEAEFTLQFENKNNIYGCAVLEDKMSGKMIDMTEEESYTFYSEEGEYDRFEIHLKKSPFNCFEKNDGNFSAAEFELLNENGNHFIAYNIGGEQDLAQIRILDAVGRQVTEMVSHSIENQGKIQLNTRNLRGIYLIQLQTEDGREFSAKIYAQ